jgi:signal transduction histidine kinase
MQSTVQPLLHAKPQAGAIGVQAKGQLSRKLLSGLALGLGLSSLVFLALIVGTYRERLASERAKASQQVSRLLQVSLENAMLKRDLPGLQDIVTRLGEQPGILSVRILNPQGEVRFASDPAHLHQLLTPGDLGCADCPITSGTAARSQIMTTQRGFDVLRSVTPIANKDACKECHGSAAAQPVNGILVVDHEAAGIRADAMNAALMMSGAGFLVVLLGLGTVWAVLKRQVLEPVTALDSASRALGAGRLDTRVAPPPGRADELVSLCHSFNGMAERIQQGVHAVREKEAFLKGLINTVPDGVRVIDENYNVIMANAAYARQAQQSEEQVVNVPCYVIHGRNEPCPPTLVTCPFHVLTSVGETAKYIHRHQRADGSTQHVETTAASLTLDGEGGPRRLIIEAIRDLEQQMKYSQEQRLSEIGQLAAGVAHEIYNPLASVKLGLTALLREQKPEPAAGDTASYLALVDNEVDKCIRVTKRLLDLSHAPSQNLQLVSFSDAVPDVVSLLRYEAEQVGVTLNIDLGNEDLRVIATDSELRMLVLNLVQNAFHAMPKGGILTIEGRREGTRVRLTFADTGIGIAADALPSIFDPFYSKRADGVQGTGLGLTICKAIATRYQGTIAARSEPGHGAVFALTFPFAGSMEAAT